MSKKSKHKKLLDITCVALFAALCYISLTLFFFPFANMFIHFGNLLVVTASLLLGGWQGGMSGAVGMGLFDLVNGHAESAPKTLLLKLLIGITVGIVFSALNRRKKYPVKIMIGAFILTFILTMSLGIYSFTKNGKLTGKSGILSIVFAVITLLLALFMIFRNKLTKKTAAAALGAVCGMAINIIGETLWKVFEFLIAGSDIHAAFISAVLLQGSTLINAGIAIVGGVALYKALEKPFSAILKK